MKKFEATIKSNADDSKISLNGLSESLVTNIRLEADSEGLPYLVIVKLLDSETTDKEENPIYIRDKYYISNLQIKGSISKNKEDIINFDKVILDARGAEDI